MGRKQKEHPGDAHAHHCSLPPTLPPYLVLSRLESLPRGSTGAFTFVFNEGYSCTVQQHMDARTAWGFKCKPLRYACHKSKHPCQHTQCAAHGASLGSPQQPPVPSCKQQQPQNLQSWGRCTTLAMQMSPDKTLTPTHFILSQQCKRWRSNVATSPTLSQPDPDKLLPVTCNLPGIQLWALQRVAPIFMAYGDGTFHLFIYFSLPLSSVSKQPWAVISSVLLSHCFPKSAEKNQNMVGRETQAGLNTNINHSEGVGPGTIFFTFHSVFKKYNHLQPPKDTSLPPL